MKLGFSPDSFHLLAINFQTLRWRLLAWSAFAFTLFILLQTQITTDTPNTLVWLVLFVLFFALQTLVFGSFIFFFQLLPSSKANNKQWFKIYRLIEWSEASLFFLLLPLPTLVFLYALLTVN